MTAIQTIRKIDGPEPDGRVGKTDGYVLTGRNEMTDGLRTDTVGNVRKNDGYEPDVGVEKTDGLEPDGRVGKTDGLELQPISRRVRVEALGAKPLTANFRRTKKKCYLHSTWAIPISYLAYLRVRSSSRVGEWKPTKIRAQTNMV